MPTKVKLNAYQLRALAESIDGKRGSTFDICEDPTGKHPAKAIEQATGNVRVEIEARAEKKEKKPKVAKLRVVLPQKFTDASGTPVDGEGPNLDEYTNMFDAIFWDESSVEKFLLPYYVHLMPVSELSARMDEYYDDPDVIAFAHLPDSEVVPDLGITSGKVPIPGLFTISADRGGRLKIAAVAI